MLHCTAAGCAPPELAWERLKVTLPPGAALPELDATVTCCAIAWLAIAANSTQTIPNALLADFNREVKLIYASIGGRLVPLSAGPWSSARF